MVTNNQPYSQTVLDACKQAFIYVWLFSLVVNVLMLTVPIYMLQIFDRVLASYSYDTLFYLTAIALAALLVFGLLDIARMRILTITSTWMDKRLGPEALSRCPDEILLGRNYGGQSLRDISVIRQFLGSAGVLAIFDSPWVPLYLAVIFLLHPYLGLLATAGAIILFALAVANELSTRKLLMEANQIAMPNQARAESALRNSEAIQAMGMMPSITASWNEENTKLNAINTKISHLSNGIHSTSKLLRLILQLLMLGLGAFLVVKTELTPGGMIAGSILLARALQPVEQAIGTWKNYLNAKQAFERLQQHFSIENPRTAIMELPEPKGLLAAEGVYYRAPNAEKPILQNINFTVQPGELVAIIGPSGAGKSSLARLMVGCWPATAGKMRLDSADVYTWQRADVGKHIGYLPQDIELFMGSVKQNIARMGEVDANLVVEASQLAAVHDLVLHFPEGYDTELGTAGFQLSGGQRQRIALARTLYGDPKLLVLDEPNSNLDQTGEEALQQALTVMRNRGCTIIVISHRMNILNIADKIMFLNQGQVQAFGPRDEVLQQLQNPTEQQGSGSNVTQFSATTNKPS